MAEAVNISKLASARRPVPRWRRLLSLFGLLVIIAALTAYLRLTNEARLRSYAQSWLENFSGGEARVGRVDFDPFTGLSLSGVAVAVPRAAGFDPLDDSFEARTVFRSGALFLRLQPLSIFTRSLVVPEIVAVDPELVLVRRTADDLGNWQCLFKNRRGGPAKEPPRLPVIRLRNARLSQYQLGEKGRFGGAAQVVWADAQPLRDRPQVYDLKLGKVTTSGDGRQLQGETARLQIDMMTRAVSGNLPTMTIDELLFTASPQVIRWLKLLDIRGTIRPDRIVYDGSSSGAVKLSLRDASFAVPIDADEETLEPARRYLRFEGIAGELQFDHGDVKVNLQARFRDRPVGVQGKMWLGPEGIGGGLDAIGLDLSLTADQVPLPRNDADADPSEVRFVNRGKHLRNFVRDFDGRGPVDLALRLRKPPGSGSNMVLEGDMILRGDSGRYLKFPYRLEEMTGKVHFRPDGSEDLDLAGRHGQGHVTISGWEGGYKTQGGTLTIRGHHIELDDALRACLEEDDQVLCKRFNVQARMDIVTRMKRKDAPPGTPNNPWTSEVDISFLDGSVNFDGFPYPLESLGGRLHIAGGKFDLEKVTASRGDTRVLASGTASWTDAADASLDLHIEAERVPFDAMLAAALPADIRREYDRMTPAGMFDVAGQIVRRPDLPRVQYQLRAALRGASLTTPWSPARLTQTEAELELAPDEIVISSARARFAESEILLDGRLGLRPDAAFRLHLASERIALDQNLHSVLPEAWQATWDKLQPGGPIKLDLVCSREAAPTASQPSFEAGGAQPPSMYAEVPAAETAPRQSPAEITYVATVEPLDVRATYAGFPLPLEGIRGRLTLTPEGVRIEKLFARHDDTTFEAGGRVVPAASGTRAELSLTANRLQLDEHLRQALPGRLRRQWNEVKPRGEMDLEFNKLVVDAQHGGATTWEFEGSAAMRDLGMSVGPELAHAFGTIAASGRIGGDLTLDGRVALSQVDVDGRRLTGAVAELRREPGSHLLSLDNLFARMYSGTVAGRSEVDYRADVPRYAFALTIRDVALDAFLNSSRDPSKPWITAKGVLDASLSLSGQPDRPATRRGGGSISIREAQVFKIPLLFAFLKVISLTVDDNAFHDATATFAIEGAELVLSDIDLRGSALSLVGAGRVDTPTEKLDLTLLVGSPMRLPRLALLTDLVESLARELMEVRVEGTLSQPEFRAEMVRSLRKALDEISNARRRRDKPSEQGTPWSKQPGTGRTG